MANTTTILASGYANMVNYTINSTYPINRAYTDTASTTYTQLNVSKKNGTGEVDFNFDFSAIPKNAKITSITVKVKAMVSSTTYITAATVQAMKNGVAVDSSTNYRKTSATVYTLSVGSWTRAELDTFAIHFTAKKSNTNSTAYTRIYGMEVEVVWEEPPEPTQQLKIKVNGIVREVVKVYHGNTLIEDWESFFDETTNYVIVN